MVSLGERVKHERERRRYSQEELAKHAQDYPGAAVAHRSGQGLAPSADVIKRLARGALGEHRLSVV